MIGIARARASARNYYVLRKPLNTDEIFGVKRHTRAVIKACKVLIIIFMYMDIQEMQPYCLVWKLLHTVYTLKYFNYTRLRHVNT